MRITSLIVLLFLAGCSSRLPVITDEQARHVAARWPQVTSGILNEGRRMYMEKCSSCHSLHVPSAFSEEQWATAMDKMQSKAHLTDEEKELIIKYIIAARKR